MKLTDSQVHEALMKASEMIPKPTNAKDIAGETALKSAHYVLIGLQLALLASIEKQPNS